MQHIHQRHLQYCIPTNQIAAFLPVLGHAGVGLLLHYAFTAKHAFGHVSLHALRSHYSSALPVQHFVKEIPSMRVCLYVCLHENVFNGEQDTFLLHSFFISISLMPLINTHTTLYFLSPRIERVGRGMLYV